MSNSHLKIDTYFTIEVLNKINNPIYVTTDGNHITGQNAKQCGTDVVIGGYLIEHIAGYISSDMKLKPIKLGDKNWTTMKKKL